jgi:beta-1,4-mannosyltransferase
MRTDNGSTRPAHNDASEGVRVIRLLATSTTNAPNANSFPSLWTDAVRRAGVDVHAFSARKAALEDFDGVHVHWPDELFGRVGRDPRRLLRALTNLGAVAVAKVRGASIYWTVHNIDPHDSSKDVTSRVMLRVFERLVDEFWVMSRSTASELTARHSREVAVRLIRHPAYPVADQPSIRSAPRRAISFGEVRPYRGYVELCEQFSRITSDWTLVIAGNGRRDRYSEMLGEQVAKAPSITWIDERLTDEELVVTILGSAVVVLFYKRVTNSGAALMALTLRRPVIVPDTEAFRELSSEVGAGWVQLYTGDLEESLRSAVAPKGADPDLRDRTWEKLGGAVRDAVTLRADDETSSRRHASVTRATGRLVRWRPRQVRHDR